MTAKVGKRKRSLPFINSLFPFDIEGRYTRVSKTSGTLHRCGQKSIWISPRGQLIYNLGKKGRYQGTLIAHLNFKMKDDVVLMFTYFGKHYSIQKIGEVVLIREEYQSDLVSNFVTSTQKSTI
jgi:hypothetical protein